MRLDINGLVFLVPGSAAAVRDALGWGFWGGGDGRAGSVTMGAWF